MKKKENVFKISNEEVRKIYQNYQLDLTNPEYDDEELELFTSFNNLNSADKMIMILYAETQSQRKTADILGVSRTTFIKLHKQIKEKILKNNNDND